MECETLSNQEIIKLMMVTDQLYLKAKEIEDIEEQTCTKLVINAPGLEKKVIREKGKIRINI